MPEFRQNTDYGTIKKAYVPPSIEIEEKKGDSEGNTRLPFGLCKKYGISLPDKATQETHGMHSKERAYIRHGQRKGKINMSPMENIKAMTDKAKGKM